MRKLQKTVPYTALLSSWNHVLELLLAITLWNIRKPKSKTTLFDIQREKNQHLRSGSNTYETQTIPLTCSDYSLYNEVITDENKYKVYKRLK